MNTASTLTITDTVTGSVVAEISVTDYATTAAAGQAAFSESARMTKETGHAMKVARN